MEAGTEMAWMFGGAGIAMAVAAMACHETKNFRVGTKMAGGYLASVFVVAAVLVRILG